MTYAILSREINDLLDLGKKLIRASGATLYRQQLIINYNRNIIVFFLYYVIYVFVFTKNIYVACSYVFLI